MTGWILWAAARNGSRSRTATQRRSAAGLFGWLLHDGDDCKVIVPHVTEDHENAVSQGCGDMTIPTSSILNIFDLAAPAVPVAEHEALPAAAPSPL